MKKITKKFNYWFGENGNTANFTVFEQYLHA